MFILDINITERTHIWKPRSRLGWSHIDPVTLCSISVSRRWDSPVSCGWERGDLLGKLPSFYCSKSSVKHLNLHLSKSLLERGLFFLQLLRIAEQKYHLSQWDLNGGFPLWTPTLNSLETEVLGIVFFIRLAQAFTGSYFPPNFFKKILMSHSFRPACVSWVKIEHTGFMFWFMDQICKFAFEKHLTHNSGKLNFAVWYLWLDETLWSVWILPGARPDPPWFTTGDPD